MMVHGHLVLLWKWSMYSCQHMDEMDANMYWAKFPGMPSHLFRMAEQVAGVVGRVVSAEMPVANMEDDHTPVLCVQIADEIPMLQQ